VSELVERLDYKAAHASPSRDSTYPPAAWQRAERDLVGVEAVFEQLATRYEACFKINRGGRYPEPTRELERRVGGALVCMRLAPRPYGADGSALIGYELGVQCTPATKTLRRWWIFGSRRPTWRSFGILGAVEVRLGAPAVAATLARVAADALSSAAPAV
jgi:hypothetical protein